MHLDINRRVCFFVLSSASELFTVHIIRFRHFVFSVKHEQEPVCLNLRFSNEILLQVVI